MGVYIKGMKMPKGCYECALKHRTFNGNETIPYCYAICEEVFDDGEVNEDCPLVPVPPHGDLIDRDKLRKNEFIHDGDLYAVVMSRDIRNAPTIIPAEEG